LHLLLTAAKRIFAALAAMQLREVRNSFWETLQPVKEKLGPHIDPVFIKKEDAERKTEGQV